MSISGAKEWGSLEQRMVGVLTTCPGRLAQGGTPIYVDQCILQLFVVYNVSNVLSIKQEP